MRSTLVLSALVALVAAIPSPQGMNFDVIDAVPPPTETAPAAGASDVEIPFSSASASAVAIAAIKTDPIDSKKRKHRRGVNDACAPQPSSANPPAGDNSTPGSFTSDSNYASTASGAATPAGYNQVFTNLQASTQQDGFLRLKTLDTYDPVACQKLCDSTDKCLAFNLYLERDPSVAPANNCTDPAPVTNVKCTLYGLPISSSSAKNTGQYRQQFHVVITASNGYNKNPVSLNVPGYSTPIPLTCAINAPLAQDGSDTYIGSTSFNGPFAPGACGDACTQQTKYDSQHPDQNGNYKTCAFFNAYILSKNGIAQGTYCAFYTQHWDNSVAVNCGQNRGKDVYTVSYSYSYDLSP